MNRPLTALAAALLLCTACTPTSSTTPVSQPVTSTATSTASLSDGGRPQAPGGTAPATLGITWNEASKKTALDIATEAMSLYTRPTVPKKVWIQELGQLMTSQAVADYQYVDPSNIPVSKITGPGQLKIDENNGFGCQVIFPTDTGSYEVQLLRSAADKPWQVNRFTPPHDAK